MKISALLTSAGINVALCAVLLTLYSVLRKQPGNAYVYFGRRLAQEHGRNSGSFTLERLVPSPGWIFKAWEYTDNDILSVAGLDAVAFIRILVFSMRIFSIAAVLCVFVVLPMNYFGNDGPHSQIPSESLDVFTIANIKEGSQWLWVHCFSLYTISCAACILLYFEYKNIARMRLAHLAGSPPKPSHFTVLVRAIPWSAEESFSDTVNKFFSKYHASSYLSHQMIYKSGKVQMIMLFLFTRLFTVQRFECWSFLVILTIIEMSFLRGNAEKVYDCIKDITIEQRCRPARIRCCLCGGTSSSFKAYHNIETDNGSLQRTAHVQKQKECAAAFIFFKTRYAAIVASRVLQSSNPMIWVTDLAPEPHDVYWSNLWIPYKQLWIRHIATLLAAIVFMFLFLIPVTLVQGLSQLEQLQQRLPFLRGILKKNFVSQLVTGYLPSVILMLFLYMVPPTMMLFSSVEGPISRSARKKSACCKILYFNIWNVFIVNVLSGSIISQLNVFFNPKDIPTQLAKAVPGQATFFITYVLTSGWTSLSSEVMQLFPLICNFIKRYVCRSEVDPEYVPSFPYHTEVPRVLLFGLLGFTCAILAPLILPFLLAYFFLGYIVYRNQILNVYCARYDTGGQMWPIAHNTTIFSLVLAQIIALGVFGLKKSPTASGFVVPLVIFTLLFHEYCRKRFLPVFNNIAAQDVIEMDREDDQNGRMEGIHLQLLSAYCQNQPNKDEVEVDNNDSTKSSEAGECSSESKKSSLPLSVSAFPTSAVQRTINTLALLITNPHRIPTG